MRVMIPKGIKKKFSLYIVGLIDLIYSLEVIPKKIGKKTNKKV